MRLCTCSSAPPRIAQSIQDRAVERYNQLHYPRRYQLHTPAGMERWFVFPCRHYTNCHWRRTSDLKIVIDYERLKKKYTLLLDQLGCRNANLVVRGSEEE